MCGKGGDCFVPSWIKARAQLKTLITTDFLIVSTLQPSGNIYRISAIPLLLSYRVLSWNSILTGLYPGPPAASSHGCILHLLLPPDRVVSWTSCYLLTGLYPVPSAASSHGCILHLLLPPDKVMSWTSRCLLAALYPGPPLPPDRVVSWTASWQGCILNLL